jgi:hypothetical protein
VDFGGEVDGEVLGALGLDDFLVLGEDAMVEVADDLGVEVVVEVADDGAEEAGDAGGDGRAGVEDAKEAVVGELDSEARGEGQGDLEDAPPKEILGRAMLVLRGEVADGAGVGGAEAVREGLDFVARDDGVAAVAEGAGVDPREVGDVEEALELAAGGGVDVPDVGEDADEGGVVEFVELGQRGLGVGVEAGPRRRGGRGSRCTCRRARSGSRGSGRRACRPRSSRG